MIVAIAWAAAVLVALVVLGFCGYELRWKSARLRADLTELAELGSSALQLQAEFSRVANELTDQVRPDGAAR